MARPASGPGRLLERIGDDAPRGMTVHDRTRLIGRLRHCPEPVFAGSEQWRTPFARAKSMMPRIAAPTLAPRIPGRCVSALILTCYLSKPRYRLAGAIDRWLLHRSMAPRAGRGGFLNRISHLPQSLFVSKYETKQRLVDKS